MDSMYEPGQRKPRWGLTPAEFTRERCAECGELFRTDLARGVEGGLMIVYDETAPGGRLLYHGYESQEKSCYRAAEKKGFPVS